MKTKFIEQRQKEAENGMPKMRELFNFLEEKIIGSMVVPMPESIKDIEVLMERGELFGKTEVSIEMIPGRCHENSSFLYLTNKGEYEIVTGYAYTKKDNMWRQHTWLSRVEDKAIVETTVDRDIYFGVVLTTEEALNFALNNEG